MMLMIAMMHPIKGSVIRTANGFHRVTTVHHRSTIIVSYRARSENT